MSKDQEVLELKTKVASLSMLLAAAQASTAQLTKRAAQAEEMVGLLQTGPEAQKVAELIIRHMDQNHQVLAVHQMNLIQTTTVALSQALQGNDEELRSLVNTVVKGLNRSLETMQQIRLAENEEQANARRARKPSSPINP